MNNPLFSYFRYLKFEINLKFQIISISIAVIDLADEIRLRPKNEGEVRSLVKPKLKDGNLVFNDPLKRL